jgi:hypothetical protein
VALKICHKLLLLTNMCVALETFLSPLPKFNLQVRLSTVVACKTS